MYLWEREGSPDDSSMRFRDGERHGGRDSGISTPAGAGAGAGAAITGSAAAYYPPRSFARTSSNSTLGGTGTTTTVRPLKVLAGHGAGAVFDVRARRGTLLSAGEDGAVGVWGDEE